MNTTMTPGMYQTDNGEIFKVQKSKQSGHLYAKHLQPIGGTRMIAAGENAGERVHFEFVYAPGAIQALRPEMALTMEAAVAFGIKYGVCCVCGAFLKDATSVEKGIGPVCRKRIAPAATIQETVIGPAQRWIEGQGWVDVGVDTEALAEGR